MRHNNGGGGGGGGANPQLQQQGLRGYASPIPETSFNHSQMCNELHFNSSQVDYAPPPPETKMVIPRAPGVKLQHTHSFPSKLHPPLHRHHPNNAHISQLHQNSTLPPIHLHHGVGMPGGGGGGGGGVREVGQPIQTLSKLPTIIHGRSKTYGGRTNRTGYIYMIMVHIIKSTSFLIMQAACLQC